MFILLNFEGFTSIPTALTANKRHVASTLVATCHKTLNQLKYLP